MKSLFFIMILLVVGCSESETTHHSVEKENRDTMHPAHKLASQLDVSSEVDSVIDKRDGEVYSTITIGEQTWMAENMRFKAEGSWLNPDNPLPIYGRLYSWVAAQSVCPEGWRLPSDAEWSELEVALGMDPLDKGNTFWRGTHAATMKSTTGWEKSGKGTNSSRFNVYPTGFYFDGKFDGLGYSAGFWSTKNSLTDSVWVRFFAGPQEGVNRFMDSPKRDGGIACRCIRDSKE